MASRKDIINARKRNNVHAKKVESNVEVVGLMPALFDQDNRKDGRKRSNDFIVPSMHYSDATFQKKVQENMQSVVDHNLKSGPVKSLKDYDGSSIKISKIEYDRLRAVKICKRYNRVSLFRTFLKQGYPLTEKQIKYVFQLVAKWIHTREKK